MSSGESSCGHCGASLSLPVVSTFATRMTLILGVPFLAFAAFAMFSPENRPFDVPLLAGLVGAGIMSLSATRKTPHGRTTNLALFLRSFRLGRERRRYLKGVRERVESAVASNLSSGAAPEQLAGELDALERSTTDLRQFRRDALSAALGTIKRNQRLSPQEDALLKLLASRFAIPTSAFERADLYRYRVLWGIDHDQLPELTISGLVLRKGETAYWSEPGAILEERVVRREYVGGSSGASFRVAKGVWVRSGSYRGHVESEKGIVPISNGALILTNHRVIFHGDNKSIDAKWDHVVDVDYLWDGVRLSISGHSKPTLIRFNNRRNAEIVRKLISYIVAHVPDD
jgi:hypothetical protein